MVKTEQGRGSPEYTGGNYSKKKADLLPKCKMVAGTGSADAKSVVRVRKEAKNVGNVSVVIDLPQSLLTLPMTSFLSKHGTTLKNPSASPSSN